MIGSLKGREDIAGDLSSHACRDRMGKGVVACLKTEISMNKCEKCQLPVKFVQKLYSGVLKWTPVNPDGSDHWDACKTVQRKAMGMIRPDGSVDMEKLNRMAPPRYTGQHVKWVYCGSVPPWDDSLGPFRKFTEAEKQAGVVCRRTGGNHATAA